MPTSYDISKRNKILQQGTAKLDFTKLPSAEDKMDFFRKAEKSLLDFIAEEKANKYPDEKKILSAENKLKEVRKSIKNLNTQQNVK